MEAGGSGQFISPLGCGDAEKQIPSGRGCQPWLLGLSVSLVNPAMLLKLKETGQDGVAVDGDVTGDL